MSKKRLRITALNDSKLVAVNLDYPDFFKHFRIFSLFLVVLARKVYHVSFQRIKMRRQNWLTRIIHLQKQNVTIHFNISIERRQSLSINKLLWHDPGFSVWFKEKVHLCDYVHLKSLLLQKCLRSCQRAKIIPVFILDGSPPTLVKIAKRTKCI